MDGNTFHTIVLRAPVDAGRYLESNHFLWHNTDISCLVTRVETQTPTSLDITFPLWSVAVCEIVELSLNVATLCFAATVRHCGYNQESSQSRSYRWLDTISTNYSILMRTYCHSKVGYCSRSCACNSDLGSFRGSSVVCSVAADDTEASKRSDFMMQSSLLVCHTYLVNGLRLLTFHAGTVNPSMCDLRNLENVSDEQAFKWYQYMEWGWMLIKESKYRSDLPNTNSCFSFGNSSRP